MSNRKYYCFCDSNCKFETMTKEQILAAIAQAAESGLVFDEDAAFITKVKETNAGNILTFWVGTQAQYNALQTIDKNCQYIITDDTFKNDVLMKVGGKMRGDIDMGGHKIIGLSSPTTDNEAATKKYADTRTARNLLDNSDFTNPVNQRGDTTYTGAVYGIDRWIGGGGQSKVLAESNGVTLVADADVTGIFNQRLDYALSKSIYGKVCTVAFCEIDGTITIASGVFVADDVSSTTKLFGAPSANGDYQVEIHKFSNTQNFNVRVALNAGLSKTFIWAALYEGEYTAETLPTYVPKGYGAELTECQRYFFPFNMTLAGLITEGRTLLRVNIPVPITMRIKPSIANYNASGVRHIGGGSINPTVTSASINVYANCIAGYYYVKEMTEVTNNTPITGYFSGELSADL